MTSEFYTLSKEQLQNYANDGYLIIREFFDQALLDKFRKRFLDICNGEFKQRKYLIYKHESLKDAGLKGEAVVNKIQNVETDEVFSSYYEHPRLLDVVSQLVGEDVFFFHGIVFNKPPGSGQHYPHQDFFYIPLLPADKIVGTWTAIDHVTVDNGCLYMVPGSHKSGELHRHSKLPGNDVMYYGVEKEDLMAPIEKRVNLPMSPGDVVFFHPLVVHGSRPNVSKRFRKAISCHFASCECRFIQLEGTPQEHLAKAAEAILRRQGICDNYTEFYRMKSRVVKGNGALNIKPNAGGSC